MVGNGEGLVVAGIGYGLFQLQILTILISYTGLLVVGLQRRLNAKSAGVALFPLGSWLVGVAVFFLPAISSRVHVPEQDFAAVEIAVGVVGCGLPALGSLLVGLLRWYPTFLRCLFSLFALSSLALLTALIVFSRLPN